MCVLMLKDTHSRLVLKDTHYCIILKDLYHCKYSQTYLTYNFHSNFLTFLLFTFKQTNIPQLSLQRLQQLLSIYLPVVDNIVVYLMTTNYLQPESCYCLGIDNI